MSFSLWTSCFILVFHTVILLDSNEHCIKVACAILSHVVLLYFPAFFFVRTRYGRACIFTEVLDNIFSIFYSSV